MPELIIAKFDSIGEAEKAFADLLERDARAEDLTIAAMHVPVEPTLAHKPEPVEEGEPADLPPGASPPPPDLPEHEEFPTIATPFGLVPGGPRILISDGHSGDLILKLMELGIGDSISLALADTVMAGGALLLVQTPSGDVDELLAWQVIEQCGGSGVTKGTPSAYAS